MYKQILSFLLLISMILVLYPQIDNYSKIPDSDLTNDLKTKALTQIIGFFLLFFVVFCAIWAIPETTVRQRIEHEEDKTQQRLDTEQQRFDQEKKDTEKTESEDEDVDEMLAKGYVFNVATGKWENPKAKKKTVRT